MNKIFYTYLFIALSGFCQAAKSLDSLASILITSSEEAFETNDENFEFCNALVHSLPVDSVDLVLAKLPENVYTAFTLTYLAYHYTNRDKPLNQGIEWLRRAEKIANQISNDRLNYWLYRHKAFIKQKQGKVKETIAFFRKSNAFALKANYPKGETRNLLHLAEAYQAINDLQMTFEYAEENLKRRLNTPVDFGLAYAHYYLGERYAQIEDYEQSDSHLLLAEKYFREIKDMPYVGLVIESRANVYLAKEQPDSALLIIQSAKALYEKKEDQYFLGNWFLKVGKIYEQKGDLETALENTFIADSILSLISRRTYSVFQLGEFNLAMGNYNEAKDYFNTYLAIMLKKQTTAALPLAYNYLAIIAIHEQNYEEAQKFSETGIYYAALYNLERNKFDILTTLHESYYKQKKYDQANEIHQQILELSKKIKTDLKEKNIRNLKLSYRLKNQRDLLEKENAKTQYKKKWNNYLLWILAIGFSIILGLLIQIIRIARNRNKILADKNQEIAQLNENLEYKVMQRTNALEENSEMLNNYFENLPGAAYRFKCEYETLKPVSISKGGKELFGIDTDFFLSNQNNSRNLVDANYFEEVKRRSHEFVARANQSEVLEQVYPINVNGEKKWVTDRSKLLIDKNNEKYLDGILLDITKQKNVEQKLANKQKELSLIYNNTPDLLGLVQIRADEKFILESLNLTFINLLIAGGRSRKEQEFSGMEFSRFLSKYLKMTPLEIEDRHNYIRTVKTSLKPLVYEQIYKVAGKINYFDVNITPIVDKDTRSCSRVLFVIRNTTENVKARIALAKSEKRLSTIYNSSLDNIGLIKKVNGEYIVESFNKTSLQFLQSIGLSDETSNLIGKNIEVIFETIFELPKEATLERMNMIDQVFEEKKTFQFRSPLILKSKNIHVYFETIISPVFDAYGNCTHALYTARDISESENAKQKLLSSQRRLASIFNGTTDQMAILDVRDDGTLIFEDTNRSFKTAWEQAGFKIPLDKFYGKSAECYIKDVMGFTENKTRERLELCQQIVREKRPINFEEIYEAANGKNYLFDITIVPILNKEEICTKLLLVFRDITLKHRAKEKMISKILETEDRERSRFAKELHDSLGQNLTAASLSFNFVKKHLEHLPSEARLRFNNGVQFLKEAISESRNIAHNLMPQAISDFGYILTIESLIENLSKTTDIKFEFYDNLNGERLKSDYELGLYRITQEAINNILKHAKASKVTIQLIKHSDSVILTIEDDGKGFLYEKVNMGSFGLNSMKNRASALSGVLEVDSSPDKGTFITLEIPL